ncbi:MAG: lysylphosphatidylglycerol synthase domain-containing protein [Alphaproteobacteria bacterium]|nr:lysylphosphatidylglycerol synthase domain-containing protein [Alphaproteobacteria bacterium]
MTYKRGLVLVMLAGGLVLVALVAWHGFAEIAADMMQIGWGLVAVALLHLVPMSLSTLGWQALLLGVWHAPFRVYLHARWIRESIDGLLPVGQIGGEFVGARLMAKHGAKANLAAAGCIVDLTMEVITQFFFSLVGVAVLVAYRGYDGTVYWLIVGACVAAPPLLGFVLAQRWGMFRLIERAEALAAWLGFASLSALNGLHDAVTALHRNRRNLALGFAGHFASWVIGSGEIWLALLLLGHPVGFAEALILESLVQAVRSAAFIVPGALGVQETGYILLGTLLGLSPELGLSLALVKRARELLVGLPGLLAWQMAEGRFLLRRLDGSSAGRPGD